MIIIFGGTTEGRKAAEVADESGQRFFYSTKSELQDVNLKHGLRLTGVMDEANMERLIVTENIKLIVDAAHPFATHLHNTIGRVAVRTHTPVVRYERQYPAHEQGVRYCKDYNEAVTALRTEGIERLLALTGVNTIEPLRPYWEETGHTTFFRILHREESMEKAAQAGFPTERLLFYHDRNQLPSVQEEMEVFESLHVQAILTKESGLTGGTDIKMKVAKRLGLRIFVVCHPDTTHSPQLELSTVTGPHGLRRAIEKRVPDFFPLHTGFTTGSCATAAVHTAMQMLVTGETPTEAQFLLPDGEQMSVPVDRAQQTDERTAWAEVVKDAGSDPDVTDGCHIRATVRLSEADETSVDFAHGKGVGRVTLPGLGINVGEPAINPTPRRMIEQDIRHWAELLGHAVRACVTIEVDNGEELAKRTFNPRVGVVDGISIIGTSGIVRPFSNEAFIESIERQVDVALALETPRIVINSGAKSEAVIRNIYPGLLPQAFIHYGNFIGDTLRIIRKKSQEKFGRPIPVTLGMMLGKAVKLAHGNLTTHSHIVTMNKDFLLRNAEEAGCNEATRQTIEHTTLARTLWKQLEEDERDKFLKQLIRHCYQTCNPVYPAKLLDITLIAEDGTTCTASPDNLQDKPTK